MQLREQVYLEASINYETKWSQHFSWLVFGKTKDGFPYVKCSICMSYAKGNTRYAMQGDDGGRDLQTQSRRFLTSSTPTSRRRPVKSLKVAVAERERKGKQKEGEAVAAGTAGENEDEGEEEEEDDEVEQDLGDDQEVVEEEDNSFLSDDEDVEEVYFIDKPVH
ncbi:unnamed protein product [Closterium sp. NIES-54]